MKKLISLITIFLSAIQVFAQAPVTSINWLPNAGDKFYRYTITYTQTTNPYIDPGDTGANVTWDFNEKKFFLNSPTDSITYTTPAAIHIIPVNSQTNLVFGDSTNYVAYIKNSDGLMLTQQRITYNNSQEFPIHHIVHTNPRIQFKTNLAFRNIFYDTSIFYVHQQHSKLDSPNRGKAISVNKYDGYGTLKIVNLEFTDVIRTYESMLQRDSVYGQTDSLYSFLKIYTWHSSTMKERLLQYYIPYTLKKNGSSFDTTERNPILTLKLPAAYLSSNSTQSPPSENIKAFINGGNIEIVANHDFGITRYIVYDLQGRAIQQGKLKLFSNRKESIKFNNSSSGTYLLKLQNDKGILQSVKLIKP